MTVKSGSLGQGGSFFQKKRQYARILGDSSPLDGPELGGWSAPQTVAQTGADAVFHCRCILSDEGKVREKVESGPLGRDNFTYAYDTAGHLTQVRKNELLVEYYLYDEGGRRVQDFRAWAGERRNLTYQYDGRLVQAGNTNLEWTDKGQLAALEQGGARTVFYYGHDTRLDRAVVPLQAVPSVLLGGRRDAAGVAEVKYYYGRSLMPEKITVNGGVVAEYYWGVAGSAAGKSVGESASSRGQGNEQAPAIAIRLLRHKDVVNGLTHEFIYGQARAPERVVVSGSPQAVYRATCVHSRQVVLDVYVDQVDSIRVLALPDGRPVKCIEYDSFGNVAADTKPAWLFPLGFACGLNDLFTGLVRFGFRDYDPRFGRFTAKDPIGYSGGDGDLWDYCIDDPVGRYDPAGLKDEASSELNWFERNFSIYTLGLKHPYTQKRLKAGMSKYKQGLMTGGPAGLTDIWTTMPDPITFFFGPSAKQYEQAKQRADSRKEKVSKEWEVLRK